MDLQEYRSLKNEFQKNYFEVVKPKLNVFEKKRIKKYNLYKNVVKPICFALFFILLALAIIFFNIITKDDNGDILSVVAIPIIAMFGIRKSFEKSIEKELKNKLMDTICSCFKNLKWGEYLENQNFHDIGLVGYYNRKNFDDYFKGKYKDVDFEIIETKLKKEKNSGKRHHSVTIFEGVILKIFSNKKISSHTVIQPDDIIKIAPAGLKHTELEDVVFEKKFDVYTNDETDARYLITPTFIQKINTLEKVFKAKKTSCAFFGQHLYIALDVRKDMFKLCSLDKPINDIPMFSEMFNEIVSIYNVIDYLKLGNEKILN